MSAAAESPDIIVPLEHVSDYMGGPRERFMLSDCETVWYDPRASVVQDVLHNSSNQSRTRVPQATAFLRAGPRQHVWFDPSSVRAAVVTCGGLCPGLNTVLRNIAVTLHHCKISNPLIGVRYGYSGFHPGSPDPILLTMEYVRDIHLAGGSCIGTARGGFDPSVIRAGRAARGVTRRFVGGGDGTMRAAGLLVDALRAAKEAVSVVGVPKTIDNDIPVVDKSFGFDSAVEAAVAAIRCAGTEARSVQYGIGIVKLMGRDAGFLARNAAFTAGGVDACLIPEVDVDEKALCDGAVAAIRERGSCVVVVAEAACQRQIGTLGRDDTGHAVYDDVLAYLRATLCKAVATAGIKGTKIVCIDPSYMVRSTAPNVADQIMCQMLASAAVHSALQGYTNVCVGVVHSYYVVLPLPLLNTAVKRVNLKGTYWAALSALLTISCVSPRAPPALAAPPAVAPTDLPSTPCKDASQSGPPPDLVVGGPDAPECPPPGPGRAVVAAAAAAAEAVKAAVGKATGVTAAA